MEICSVFVAALEVAPAKQCHVLFNGSNDILTLVLGVALNAGLFVDETMKLLHATSS